ncbi:unnamed protein product [Arabis nemorensis]|uniref:Myb/SANT-like domain-containing protein n=1 Tax=Arabis nemorensis TaxID=586526 RepID=A0A565BGB1_9BRAS|nr:unnamed protein product [Arabis nemorensis]
MASNRRQNINSSNEADTSFPTKTSARTEDNFKWTPSRERMFLDLCDQGIAMNTYRIKDLSPFAKEFIVQKFNEEFHLNISYKFFKEKLDQLKRKYKKYSIMLKSTGIVVDPITSVISAYESWWKDREVSTHDLFYSKK